MIESGRPPRVSNRAASGRASRLASQPSRSWSSGRLGGIGSVAQRSIELVARADVELAEHLAQVVGDRVLADEQPRADLWVGQPFACEPHDLRLLGGEFAPALGRALADALAGRQELALGSTRERFDAHAREHFQRSAQLRAGVDAPALSPQPLAVEQVGAGELEAQTGVPKPFDRFAIQALGRLAVA